MQSFCHESSTIFSTAYHQKACESKRKRSADQNNLNPVVYNENSVIIANKGSSNWNENNLYGKSLTTEEIVHRLYILRTVLKANITIR